ncbi:hypothetical protein KCU78_g6677, partial [Aureobasidium melanogenum]
LKNSLVKLIDRDGGWRKLGARLRLNDQKVLEFHIPTQFDANQPAIAFHHEIIASSINEHPLASRLPSPSQKPELVACASDFIPLMRSKGDPEFLQDYLHTDRPMLGLRVVSFDDATLVTLSSSHLLFDGLGGKAVLDAWSLVLHGRDQEIPDLQGVYEDPLATLGTQPDVPYQHESRVMGLRQLILFGIRAFLRRTFYKLDVKYYMVCVPGSYVKKLRSNAVRDITEVIDPTAKAPFISDSDVLCAWWSSCYKAVGVVSVPCNPGHLRSDLYRDGGTIFKAVINTFVAYPSVYGAYTEIYSGLSPDITFEKFSDWVVPWGRLHPPRTDLLEATEPVSEGGNGHAKTFWEWTEEQIKDFT